jgi:hypothetical protein
MLLVTSVSIFRCLSVGLSSASTVLLCDKTIPTWCLK